MRVKDTTNCGGCSGWFLEERMERRRKEIMIRERTSAGLLLEKRYHYVGIAAPTPWAIQKQSYKRLKSKDLRWFKVKMKWISEKGGNRRNEQGRYTLHKATSCS